MVDEKECADDTPCWICKRGVTYENNEIISCSKCNVAVHQSCYAIDELPNGLWLCDVCSSNQSPETTVCELCPFFGGAYKRTDKDKWIHSICGLWIPEVFSVQDKNSQFRYTLSTVDKARYRLKCPICSKKGAAVQCCYGRCVSAIHPWCAIHTPKGQTNRIVKTDDGELLYEIFCKVHHEAVSDPIKPRPKAKQHIPPPDDDADEYYDDKASRSRRKSTDNLNNISTDVVTLSMAHATIHNNILGSKRDVTIGISPSTLPLYGVEESKQRTAGYMMDEDEEEDMQDNNDDDDDYDGDKRSKKRGRGRPRAGGKGVQNNNRSSNDDNSELTSSSKQNSSDNKKLHVPNMYEWPGQSEGEAMDLDHFWVVMSLHYPEDHPVEWIDAMSSNFLDSDCFLTADNISTSLLPIKSPKEAQALRDSDSPSPIDELRHELSDRDFNNLTDIEKRAKFLLKLWTDIEVLNDSEAVDSSVTVKQQEEDLVQRATSLFLNEKDYIISEKVDEVSVTTSDCTNNTCTLNVVFDGNTRYSAEYQVKVASSPSSSKASGWSEVAMKERDSDSAQFVHDNLICYDCNTTVTLPQHVQVALKDFRPIDDSAAVQVAQYTIRPKDEDNEIARIIATDQAAYAKLLTELKHRIASITSQHNFQLLSEQKAAYSHNWKLIESRYSRQRIWKSVCCTLVKGMKDYSATDAANECEEIIPASWKLAVDGRPATVSDDDKDKAKEKDEDSVCMCCFDGSSNDVNSILFCDGCNAAMHQLCYGIGEIPEGDYFCDRCRGVQAIVDQMQTYDEDFDADHARDLIKCCLCPNYHGGIKPTTDGRWVHMCCAIWSNDAVIVDMDEMGPIDVTAISVQPPYGAASSCGNGNVYTYKYDCTISSPCCFCHLNGGFLVKCSHTECECAFHPLCAWFNGVMIVSTVIDPTYQGLDRLGLYPSGLSFQFYCNDHSSMYTSPNRAVMSRDDQIIQRNKYKMNVNDLDQIPGTKRRRVPKKKIPKESTRSAVPKPQVKELNPDIYDDHCCAVCMLSIVPPDWSTPIDESAFIAAAAAADTSAVSLTECAEVSTAEPAPDADASIVDAMVIDEAAASHSHALPTPSLITTADISHTQLPPDGVGILAIASTDCSTASVDKSLYSVQCDTCKIRVHYDCCNANGISYPSADDPPSTSWRCDVCIRGESNPTCILCSRRGGAYLPTTEGQWAHVYCSRNGPGSNKVSNGRIEVRSCPKEYKKQKCVVCNRRTGVCLKCNSLGCASFFHPICSERSGRAYVCTRLGVTQCFCTDHIPEGVEKLQSGYWADGHEILSLRLSLDRARIVLDMICKREKLKRLQSKAEGELFALSFTRMLDRAKGRKSDGGDADAELLYETESEYYTDDDDTFDGAVVADKSMARFDSFDRWTKKDGEPTMLKLSYSDEEVAISPSFFKRGEPRLPRRLTVSYAGIELQKKDTMVDGMRVFAKNSRERLKANVDATRGSCGIFASDKDFAAFAKDLSATIARHLSMTIPAWKKEMNAIDFKYDLKKLQKREVEVVQEMVCEPVGKKAKKAAAIEEAAAAVEAAGIPSTSSYKKRSREREPFVPSGVYVPHKQLGVTLENNSLTKSIQQLSVQNKSGYDAFYSMLNLVDVDTEDWAVQDEASLPILERRIQDMLQDIESIEVTPDNTVVTDESSSTVAAPPATASKKKKLNSGRSSSSSSSITQNRLLSDDFLQIPYEYINDYHDFVRHLLTLDVLKLRLKHHQYRTMSAFSKDFYEMLNNGRAVTETGSQTWIDTSILAGCFEQQKMKSNRPTPSAVSRTPGGGIVVTEAAMDGSDDTTGCLHCSKRYHIGNLPNASLIQKTIGNKPYAWTCPACIVEQGATLNGKKVAIWWQDDECLYEGVINYYDLLSQRHRVQYDDGLWEFVSLCVEPCIFLL